MFYITPYPHMNPSPWWGSRCRCGCGIHVPRARITLSGRAGSYPRTVYADDVEIGVVAPSGAHWRAEDTQGRNHGEQYNDAFSAARQLALGLKISA